MILALSAGLSAQTHKVAAPEKVTRAVGVYEWTGDLAKPTAARLVPVSLFIEGTLQDAGTYYARPIPLALLNGNIYSLETAGLTQGTVRLDYARHLQTATSAGSNDMSDLGWFGYGVFTPPPAPKAAMARHPSKDLPVIVSSKDASDGDRPHFGAKPDAAAKSDDKAAGDAKPVDAKPAPTVSVPDDPDRPHLSKSAPPPAETAPPAKPDGDTNATATIPASKPEDENDPDRPTLRHRDPKQAEADRKARAKQRGESGVVAMPGSLNNDPDRPVIRRGVPGGLESAAPQLTGMPANLHQSVAVSDAANREPHPFAREWDSPAEEATVRDAMEALARPLLTAYAARNQQHLFMEPARPGVNAMANGALPPRAKPGDYRSALGHESLDGYLLSYGGLPTFVFSAIASASGVGPEFYITVVAQRLPSGELQVALSSVTDSMHLDRAPWLRFVDVVDPDAGHRASLLFELRAHTSRQFALYRILSAQAEQIFVTHPTE